MPRHSTKIEVVCGVCQKKFLLTPGNMTRGRGKFCSRYCYAESKKVALKKRFFKYVSEPDANGCIIWTGAKGKSGYGVIGDSSKGSTSIRAHRVAYELAYGPFDKSLFVLHRCDNVACVNHEHLFLGTHDDNMADKVKKGRQAKGVTHGQSKLTEDDVKVIRERCANGELQEVIAKDFGISQIVVSRIHHRILWKHI